MGLASLSSHAPHTRGSGGVDPSHALRGLGRCVWREGGAFLRREEAEAFAVEGRHGSPVDGRSGAGGGGGVSSLGREAAIGELRCGADLGAWAWVPGHRALPGQRPKFGAEKPPVLSPPVRSVLPVGQWPGSRLPLPEFPATPSWAAWEGAAPLPPARRRPPSAFACPARLVAGPGGAPDPGPSAAESIRGRGA
ncbi:uncharacterized protein LOC110198147 [Phascolarctos cinereus]